MVLYDIVGRVIYDVTKPSQEDMSNWHSKLIRGEKAVAVSG
jgi:hypothetical protein